MKDRCLKGSSQSLQQARFNLFPRLLLDRAIRVTNDYDDNDDDDDDYDDDDYDPSTPVFSIFSHAC